MIRLLHFMSLINVPCDHQRQLNFNDTAVQNICGLTISVAIIK